ncbi:hypothetical protein VNO80_15932 [Phaseolus coccineus]|uniref:Uncharacterized protein n=1 Tax=Phaseolus coccineus TaxID=3886 RepID=A0AAN9R288_PHACN
MVLLVFCPCTQVCTSVLLRSSTRVSSGLALLRHSSPSFGSRQTPWSVFQDGPNGESTGRCPERAHDETSHEARAAIHNCNDDISTSISNSPGLGHHCNPCRSMSRVDQQTDSHRSTSDWDRADHMRDFKILLDLHCMVEVRTEILFARLAATSKSQHRRIKKQHRYECLVATSQLSLW